MTREQPLGRYREKRDFDRTAEPRGKGAHENADAPVFVVQHHAARSDHYDVRLEVDGVLKSWAVPKGPSTDPRDKRLARPTEDHPLEYEDFEGTIPQGEYGGGTVLVWDRGTYRNLSEHKGEPISAAEALDRGHLSVWLDGEKLHGGYALTRFRTGRDESWLLVKEKDAGADARRNPVKTEPESVRSGRDLDEIAREAGDGG